MRQKRRPQNLKARRICRQRQTAMHRTYKTKNRGKTGNEEASSSFSLIEAQAQISNRK